MSTATEAPRSTRSRLPFKPFSIGDIANTGNGLPNRYILHAVEGFGKTTLGAHAPRCIFIQSKGETGLETLIDNGRLPETPHFPECQSFAEILSATDLLLNEPHDYRFVVYDTINGVERLCHEEVTLRDYNGDPGEHGFMSYGKGPEVALTDWREFLAKLDRLRNERKMTVFLLCHTKIKPFKNPEGTDYDRYSPDMHDKTWALTNRWADVVMFGNFSVTVKGPKDPKPGSKGKASGGSTRVLYTERCAAFDAKNRLGLPREIELGDSGDAAWAIFSETVKAAKAASKGEAANV